MRRKLKNAPYYFYRRQVQHRENHLFLEKLIREITNRGYKVATIKHSHHAISLINPIKIAGATLKPGLVPLWLVQPPKYRLSNRFPKNSPLMNSLAIWARLDLILTEGFSRGNAPKVEIHRKEAGPLLENAQKLFAVITDEPLETEARQFSADDVKGVVDLFEEKFLRPSRERASLYVNGEIISLTGLPSRIMDKMLAGLADSLKTVKEVNSLEFRYHKS